jgi:4-amino-4-deoxy-L-arabinose transferase-like glycosyltransferase
MAMRVRISWATLAAVLLAAVSVAVTLHLIDYPLGAAWDELVKLRGVSTKEDIFVATFLLLALATLIRLLQEPAPHCAILLGLLIGCAAGSKYIGALILPFAILAIVLVPTPGPERRALRAGTVSAVSIGTFLLLMLPAIRRLNRWRKGVDFELTHSIQGHDVPLPPRVTWGLFHLRESLWPGLGTPLLAVGLLGLAAPFVAARERRMPLALIATFAVVWYAVHAATPLKPFPNFARYMLPLAPLLLILGTSFIYELAAWWDHRGLLAALIVVLAAVPALMMSVRINSPDVDPRGRRAFDRRGKRRARHLRSLFRLPAEPPHPWRSPAADQGHGRHRGHLKSRL